MADIYIIRERLKLLLVLVGVIIFVGAVVVMKLHSELLTQQYDPKFIFVAMLTGALVVAWVLMLLLFFLSPKLMQSTDGIIGVLDRIPWGRIWVVILIVAVASLGIGVFRFAGLVSTPFDMLREGDLDPLRELIAENPAVLEKKNRAGDRLIEVAYAENLPDRLQLLFSLGAQFSPAFVEARNPVLSSIGNPAMLRVLLEAGLEPTPAFSQANPLHLSVENGLTDSAVLLIKAGADVEVRDARFRTPLLLAAELGRFPEVRTLVESGADVNAWDRSGNTALHTAVLTRNGAMVRYLLEHGADPKIFNFKHLCPFHLAATGGNPELVERFLEKPELIDLRDEYDRTAFDHAVRGRNFDVARLLLRQGADINRVMKDGYTALHIMAIAEDHDAVQFLIEQGADLQMKDPDGVTAAQLIKRGGEGAKHLLFKLPADDTERNAEGTLSKRDLKLQKLLDISGDSGRSLSEPD